MPGPAARHRTPPRARSTLAHVAITPTLLGWIEGPFRGLDLKLSGPELVILVLGGALVLLGKVMAKAAALQAEVDTFV